MDVEKKVDEDLYSRQLFVMGHTAQARMQQSNVLIVGLDGLGIEIAKNIVLMGVKSVTLFDPTTTVISDVGGNFYLREDDVGKPRASACISRLASLNSYVAVTVLPETSISSPVVPRFDVIVACDLRTSEAVRLSDLCRNVPAGQVATRFVLAEVAGAFGRIFCDFGPSFTVDDVNGENPATALIASVTVQADGAGLVTTGDEQRHGLEDGDMLVFKEVQGMVELNDGVPRRVRVRGPYSFEIGNAHDYSQHSRGGVMTQVKMPKDVEFKPLRTMLAPIGTAGGPSMDDVILTDFGKIDRVPAVHAAFSALHASGGAPAPGDEEAARALRDAMSMHAVEALSASVLPLLLQFSRSACGFLPPMAAAIGGIAAQEVIKAVSGKFMPIKQWMYLDAAEVLPDADRPLPLCEVAPLGNRYDGQVAIFGRSFQNEILAQRYFLVGAGAIGCEMLKNWALMGVGCGEGGAVTITDMDRIERSNLSRQFLFRNEDIGQAKSTTAAGAARLMNPGLRVTPYETRVGGDSESLFDSTFWSGLTGVCTALDNVDARLYVDGRCVYYGKPLLESGTLGTKGNTQVVVPRLTENYGASRDPPERAIPVCTLKNFPSAIEHTLQWARDWFEGEFKQVPQATNAYIAQPTFLQELARETSSRIDTLTKIQGALVTSRPRTIEECVAWSRIRFQEMFHNGIQQLLIAFPADTRTSDGEPFWSGAKRCPIPLHFNSTDQTHMDFIVSASRLFGALYGLCLTPQHTPAWFAAHVTAVLVPHFEPREGIRIAANDKELEEQKKAEAEAVSSSGYDPDAQANALAATLPTPSSLAGFALNAVEFEKDDDLHISFVTACSNLRARNYRIDEKDKHTSKGIAGKIIPAIATTTAMVSGLICLELYKLMQHRALEAYRNAYANLALPIFALSEPMPVKRNVLVLLPGCTFSPPFVPGTEVVKTRPDGSREWLWSLWDRIDVQGPKTLAELQAFMKEGLGLELDMLTAGPCVLFNSFARPKPSVARARAVMPLSALVQSVGKVTLPAHMRYITLEAAAKREDGVEVELPVLRYELSGEELTEAASARPGAGAGAGASGPL